MPVLPFFLSCAKRESSVGPRGGVLNCYRYFVMLFPLFLCYVSVPCARVRELLNSGRLVVVFASRGRGLAARFMSYKD